MKSYLDAALEGKNDWWRYLIGYPFIITTWFIVGAIPIFVMAGIVTFDNDPRTNLAPTGFVGIDPLLNFTVTMVTFIPFLLATLLAVKFLHHRPIRTLVTAHSKVDWGRILSSFLVWTVICAIQAVIEALLHPGRYTFAVNLTQYIPLALVALLIVPVQTSSEEFFFRGYLIQNIGLKLKNPLVLSLLSGMLFTLPHLANPEVAQNMWLVPLFYFSFGAFATYDSLKDNSLELALGMHAGNNLFTSLFANYTDSAIQSSALFTIHTFDVTYNLLAPLVGMVIFYYVMFKLWPKREKPSADVSVPTLP
jgi:uncharacterized protein